MANTNISTQKLSLGHKIFGTKPNDGDIQPKHAWSYSIAGFGQNLVCAVIGSYLPVFMTDGAGFSALFVALLMLITRFFDAFNDPIMGSIVDKTKTKFGKCRPYLLWTPIPIAIATILCFMPVFGWSGSTGIEKKIIAGKYVGATILYVIWTILYTAIDVPYWGLSTTMTNDTYKRGKLLTVARLIATLGAGVVTVIVPLITDSLTRDFSYKYEIFSRAFNMTKETALDSSLLQSAEKFAQQKGDKLQWIYFYTAIVLSVLALPMLFIGFINTKELNCGVDKPRTLKENLGLLIKNKPLMLIVLSGVLGSARMVFAFTGGLYFAKYVWSGVEFLHIAGKPLFKGESLFTLITVAVVPGGLIASVLMPLITKKVGKKQPFIWSHIVVGILMLLVYVIGVITDRGNYSKTSTVVLVFIALFLSGIPAGFSNIASYAMIGDTVDYLELKTGKRAEGICFAMQTFINKSGLAVGAFIGILAYNLAGIKANQTGSLNAVGKDKFWAMLMLFAALSTIATAIPLFFYKFNESEQKKAREEIDKRKAEELGEKEGSIKDSVLEENKDVNNEEIQVEIENEEKQNKISKQDIRIEDNNEESIIENKETTNITELEDSNVKETDK